MLPALALVLAPLPFPAQAIGTPPGFTATVFPVGTEVSGMAPAPPGPYGEQLYACVSGQVRRIDPFSGAVTTFATGLSTGSSRPSGLAFDAGTFAPVGSGSMYVVQNNGSVVTVSPTGAVATFSQLGTLTSSNDLVFADPAGPYGARLFVSNGTFGFGTISAIGSNGVNAAFSGAAQWPWKSCLGLGFPSPGSAFRERMFAVDTTDRRVVEVQPDGSAAGFVAGLGYPLDLAFPPPGSAFGDYLYLSDQATQSVLRVDPGGSVSTFATGFGFSTNGWSGDLVFDLFGDALYAATGNDVVRIAAAPLVATCFGAAACPCGNESELLAHAGCLNSTGAGARLSTAGGASAAADDLTVLATGMPPARNCALFWSGALGAATPLGDGLACLAGTRRGLGPTTSDAGGAASWGPGLATQSGWSAGQTVALQAWYRDPTGGPCGTTYNLTPAGQVTLTP